MPRRKATKRSARTDKGWRAIAPKTRQQRRKLHARCGNAAFLDPKNLKFPIMPAVGACEIDCRGLRAAKSRAGQYHRMKIEAKAEKIGESAKCHWAR